MSPKFDSVDQRVYWGYRIMSESPAAESLRKHPPCKDESGPLGNHTMKGPPPPQLHTEVASGTRGLLTLKSFLCFSRFLGVLWAPFYLKEGIFQPGENTYKIVVSHNTFLKKNYFILCVWVFLPVGMCVSRVHASWVWSCWWLWAAMSVLNLNHSVSLSFKKN